METYGKCLRILKNQNIIFSKTTTPQENRTFFVQNGQAISSITQAKKFNILTLEQEASQTITAKVDISLLSQEPALGAGIICNHDSLNR